MSEYNGDSKNHSISRTINNSAYRKFEDTKGLIRSRNIRRTDYTMAKRKSSSKNSQNITQKTRNVATRNPLNSGGEHRRSGRVYVTVHSPYVTPDKASDKLGYKMPVLLWLNIFYFHLS